MKLSYQPTLGLLAALSLSSVALAQNEAQLNPVTETAKEYSVKVKALVGTRLTLMESNTGRRPFFNGELPSAGFRLGLNAEYGAGFAEAQIRYGGALDRFDKGGDNFIGKDNKGSIIVSRANAGMRFSSGTSFTMGRFALVDPASYTSEAADVGIDGPGGLDGLMVAQKFGEDKQFLNIQLFTANRLGTINLKEGASAPESDFMARPKNDTLAFGASVQGQMDIVKADAFVAYQAKHIQNFNQNGLLPLNEGKENDGPLKKLNQEYTANTGNMFMVGGTLGLDFDGIAFGAGYEYRSLTKRRYAKVNANGSLSKKDIPTQEGVNTFESTLGVQDLELYHVATGIQAKSSYFGVKDLLVGGDTLIAGLSYSHKGRSLDKVALPKYNEVAAHVGYEDGHLQTVLGVRYMTQGRDAVTVKGVKQEEKTYSLLNGGVEDKPISDSTTVFALVSYSL